MKALIAGAVGFIGPHDTEASLGRRLGDVRGTAADNSRAAAALGYALFLEEVPCGIRKQAAWRQFPRPAAELACAHLPALRISVEADLSQAVVTTDLV